MEMAYEISNQITILQSSIYATNQQLIQKRDELERLRKTRSQLMNYQEEFQYNQKLCNNPELSAHTWNGQLATEFHTFRSGDIQSSYQSISNRQLNGSLNQLDDKIQEIEMMIGDLHDNYVSQNSRMSNLKEMRREGLAK